MPTSAACMVYYFKIPLLPISKSTPSLLNPYRQLKISVWRSTQQDREKRSWQRGKALQAREICKFKINLINIFVAITKEICSLNTIGCSTKQRFLLISVPNLDVQVGDPSPQIKTWRIEQCPWPPPFEDLPMTSTVSQGGQERLVNGGVIEEGELERLERDDYDGNYIVGCRTGCGGAEACGGCRSGRDGFRGQHEGGRCLGGRPQRDRQESHNTVERSAIEESQEAEDEPEKMLMTKKRRRFQD
ncbi:hypothetical protein OXYTRIMIC_344 [Oxytricha trifallax]|uniref:Uncharacterized protein n=1 Tax=Oxytricha trifallax TaxID=1172189 RepID=A0A073I0X8_9SPIT|nr:hypothetical protein OXYTRIMIC_344 [Oxytricha trifallax]